MVQSKATPGNEEGFRLPFRVRLYSPSHVQKQQLVCMLLKPFPQGEEPEDSENTWKEVAKTRHAISEVIN